MKPEPDDCGFDLPRRAGYLRPGRADDLPPARPVPHLKSRDAQVLVVKSKGPFQPLHRRVLSVSASLYSDWPTDITIASGQLMMLVD